MPTSFTLDNGLRVVLAPSATDTVYAGIAVAAGTRHELDSESGMAHFVEHMSFKGTERLTSVQILNRMESVGGDLNAYTGKEETVYYSIFMCEHLRRALPLLLDIVFGSIFPQAELEKEREVVIDEIESYRDSPAELIYDDFEALLFPGHSLGRNILGNAERLRQYTSADLIAFTRRLYSPARAVLFVKGNVSEGEIRKYAASSHSTLRAASDTTCDAPGSKSITKNLFLKVMGAFIVYDSTNEHSSNNLKSWLSLIREECGQHMQILLVGNKSDLESNRAISKE